MYIKTLRKCLFNIRTFSSKVDLKILNLEEVTELCKKLEYSNDINDLKTFENRILPGVDETSKVKAEF